MTDIPRQRRRLGRTELQVSPISLGGAYLGLSAERQHGRLSPQAIDDATETLLGALDAGINLIDTSPLYGVSEIYLGHALAQARAQGYRREDIVIATKTGTRVRPRDFSYQHSIDSIHQSCEDIGTDYLDIVHIHDPDRFEDFAGDDKALAALIELREAGIVRHIGMGLRPHDIHQTGIATGEIDALLTFRDYNLLVQSALEGVLKPAAAADVGVINAQIVVAGLLVGPEPRQMIEDGEARAYDDEAKQAQAVWEWAQTRDLSVFSLALHYCLRQKLIHSNLLGVATPRELDEALEALRSVPSEADWAAFAAAFAMPA